MKVASCGARGSSAHGSLAHGSLALVWALIVPLSSLQLLLTTLISGLKEVISFRETSAMPIDAVRTNSEYLG